MDMETRLPLCILLPAKTPLFAHVLLAHQQAIDTNNLSVALVTIPDYVFDNLPNQTAAHDKYVTQCVQQGIYPLDNPQYRVLVGICDPFPALDFDELETVAAVVKRMGLFIVGHPALILTLDSLQASGISEIRAHGNVDFEITPGESRKIFDKVGSSAQAVALTIRKALEKEDNITVRNYLFGEVPKGVTQHEKSMRLSTSTYDGDGTNKDTLYITADVLTLAPLMKNKKVSSRPITDLFPEWSRTLLSSAIVKKTLRDDPKQWNYLQTLLQEMNIASFRLHFDEEQLLQDVLKHFFNVMDNDVADHMATMLRENRLLPENVVSSKLGRLCNRALWCGKLAGFKLDISDRLTVDKAHSQNLDFERANYQSAMRIAAGPPRSQEDITTRLELERLGRWVRKEFPGFEEFLRERGQRKKWISLVSYGKAKLGSSSGVPRQERHLAIPFELLLRSRFQKVDASVANKGPEGKRRPDIFIVNSAWVEFKYVRTAKDSAVFVSSSLSKTATKMKESKRKLGFLVFFIEPDTLAKDYDWKSLNTTQYPDVTIVSVGIDLLPRNNAPPPGNQQL